MVAYICDSLYLSSMVTFIIQLQLTCCLGLGLAYLLVLALQSVLEMRFINCLIKMVLNYYNVVISRPQKTVAYTTLDLR